MHALEIVSLEDSESVLTHFAKVGFSSACLIKLFYFRHQILWRFCGEKRLLLRKHMTKHFRFNYNLTHGNYGVIPYVVLIISIQNRCI